MKSRRLNSSHIHQRERGGEREITVVLGGCEGGVGGEGWRGGQDANKVSQQVCFWQVSVAERGSEHREKTAAGAAVVHKTSCHVGGRRTVKVSGFVGGTTGEITTSRRQ